MSYAVQSCHLALAMFNVRNMNFPQREKHGHYEKLKMCQCHATHQHVERLEGKEEHRLRK